MNKRNAYTLLINSVTFMIISLLLSCDSGSKLDKLLKILPMEQAVREVEVSIWETANAVFLYMVEPTETALEEYRQQLRDVELFIGKYKSLTESGKERETAKKVEALWSDTVSKADELIQLRNKIIEIEEEAWDTVHEADDIIDYKLQPTFVESSPDFLKKERYIREVEVSIWEAVNAFNFYLYKHSDKAKREFPMQLEDVKEFMDKYKRLKITSAESPHIKSFEELWLTAVTLMRECIALADELKEKRYIFWESVHAVDNVIDFEIQESFNTN